MSYVVLDAADVVELAEALEYIAERLDTLALVDAVSSSRDDWWPAYDLDQLRGDLVGFIALLRQASSPLDT
jgi:hypothetical protein